MMNRCLARIVGMSFLSALPLLAQVQLKQPAFSGWAWLTLGKIVSSDYQPLNYDYNLDGQPFGGLDAGLKAWMGVGEHSVVRLHLAGHLGFLAADYHKPNAEFLAKRFAASIADATLQSTFAFRGDRDTLKTELGYFPVKYNPDSRNLGEYLFRSGTYPGYLVSGFELSDRVKVKMLGLHASYKLRFGDHAWLANDLFYQIETDVYPVLDHSLSYIATVSPAPVVEVGVGASLAHLVSLDERRTTPGTDTVVFSHWRDYDLVWVGYADPNTGDTTLYTFRGLKLMGRMTLDVKRLFTTTIFGKEDLKVYGEAAILGVKNYPGWYENLKERVPIMGGFVLPTFKLLDVLAVEVEWYGSKYWNSQEYIWKNRSPVPYAGDVVPSIDTWKAKEDNHYKWSIYASRQATKFLRLSGQVACDHWARNTLMPPPPSYTNYTEVTPRTKDWYWVARAMFSF